MRAAWSELSSAAWVQRSSEDSSSICIDFLRIRCFLSLPFDGACCAGQFDGFGLRAPQVELAGAEGWDGVHQVHVFALGNPEARQVRLRQALPQMAGQRFGLRVEHCKTLPPLAVGKADPPAGPVAKDLVNDFLNLEVRHHLAGDFAEARETVDNLQEAVGIDEGEIAGG